MLCGGVAAYHRCGMCTVRCIELKELSIFSLVPTILLTNKHNYFFKLRYKILSAVTRKYNKLSINLSEEAVKRLHRQERHNYLLGIKLLHLENCRINLHRVFRNEWEIDLFLNRNTI